MKKKNIIQMILLLVILVAVIVGYFMMKGYNKAHPEDGTDSSASEETYPVTGFATDDVTEVSIVNGDTTIDLVKLNDAWQVAGDNSAKLDSDKVTSFLTTLSKINASDIVKDAKDAATYGLDKPSVTVTVTTFNATYKLMFGNLNSVIGKYYMSKDGDSNIYTVSSDLYEACTKKLEDFEKTDETKAATAAGTESSAAETTAIAETGSSAAGTTASAETTAPAETTASAGKAQ